MWLDNPARAKLLFEGAIWYISFFLPRIIDRGYAGATTKQMADAAGVSEVTLFRKYESKQALVKRAIAAIVEQTDFESATQYTGNIQADLLRVLNAYQNSAVLHGQFFAVLFAEIKRNPELADSFDQPLGLFRAIGQMLARYQKQGVLRQESPFHAVAALLGPMIYLAMIGGAMPKAKLPPLNLQNYLSLFLQGRYTSAST
jgi:AcrR family transcriptional regulator